MRHISQAIPSSIEPSFDPKIKWRFFFFWLIHLVTRWMVLEEVQLQRNAGTLIEYYTTLYERRYGTRPILDAAGRDEMVLKDLIKKFGFEKATLFLDAYFRMEDRWFLTKYHSLKVLQDNLNAVNVEATRRTPKASNNTPLWISSAISCGTCFKYFDVVHDAHLDWLNLIFRCPSCKIEPCNYQDLAYKSAIPKS